MSHPFARIAMSSAPCAVATPSPVALVYPFLQKYFVRGVMIGAIKE
jgi:ABC-type glycerol-3-phosphate transport system permease component